VLEILLPAATTIAAATAASDSGSSDSSSVQMCCIQAASATSGLNLLHMAAAVRSLSCAELLVLHGVGAAAVSNATSDERINELSALDLLLYDLRFLHFDELQLPQGTEAAELEPVDFDKFALMLLSCGATIKPKYCVRRLTEQFAIVQQKHSQLQQHHISSRARLPAVCAAASWHELGGNSTSSSSSSSHSIADFVQAQLVHAVTQRGAKLQTIDKKPLAQLYASIVAAAATAVSATAAGDSAGSSERTTTVTASPAAGASSAEYNNSSTTTVSSTGSNSSDSMMLAMQQSVSMKIIVTPEGWQSTIDKTM
jgi:hypothetical protein